jgi:hypothetical protein
MRQAGNVGTRFALLSPKQRESFFQEVSMSGRVRHSSKTRNQALNRLFALQEFSIANYAAQAHLHANGGEREPLAVILEIAKEQKARAAEIGSLLLARRAILQRSGFPMHFTGLNYLSASFVARRILTEQPDLIAAIRGCVEKLHGDHDGEVLARGALASEQENLWQLKLVLGEAKDEAAALQLAA